MKRGKKDVVKIEVDLSREKGDKKAESRGKDDEETHRGITKKRAKG